MGYEPLYRNAKAGNVSKLTIGLIDTFMRDMVPSALLRIHENVAWNRPLARSSVLEALHFAAEACLLASLTAGPFLCTILNPGALLLGHAKVQGLCRSIGA